MSADSSSMPTALGLAECLSLYRLYKQRLQSRVKDPSAERTERLHLLILPASHLLIAYGTFNVVLHLLCGLSNGASGLAYTFLTLTAATFTIAQLSFGIGYLLNKSIVAYYALATLVCANSVILPLGLWLQRSIFREALAAHMIWIHLLSGYSLFFLLAVCLITVLCLIIFYLTLARPEELLKGYVEKAAQIAASTAAEKETDRVRLLEGVEDTDGVEGIGVSIMPSLQTTLDLDAWTAKDPEPPPMLPGPLLGHPFLRGGQMPRQLIEDTHGMSVSLLTLSEYERLLGFACFWDVGALVVFMCFGMMIYHLVYILSFVVLQSRRSFTAILGEFQSMVKMEGTVVRFATKEIDQLHRHKLLEGDVKSETKMRQESYHPRESIIRHQSRGRRSELASKSTSFLEGYDTTPMEGLATSPFAKLMADSIAVALSPAVIESSVSSFSADQWFTGYPGITAAVSDFFLTRTNQLLTDSYVERFQYGPPEAHISSTGVSQISYKGEGASEGGVSHTSSLPESSLPVAKFRCLSVRTPLASGSKRRRRSADSISETILLKDGSYMEGNSRYGGRQVYSNLRSPFTALRNRMGSVARHIKRKVSVSHSGYNRSHYNSRVKTSVFDQRQKISSLLLSPMDVSTHGDDEGGHRLRSATLESPLRVPTGRSSLPRSRGSTRSRMSSSPQAVTSRTPVPTRRPTRGFSHTATQDPDSYNGGWRAGRYTSASRVSDIYSSRSPDTMCVDDARFFDDDMGSTTTGDFERAVQNDLWMEPDSSRDRSPGCLPVWTQTLVDAWRVAFAYCAWAASKSFSLLWRICLSRELTIFPASRRQNPLLPEQNMFCHFKDRRYERWYCEWLQTYTPKVYHYMRRPLLVCTGLQFLLLVCEAFIETPRCNLAWKVDVAQWAPIQEPSAEDILNNGGVFTRRSNLERYNGVVTFRWILMFVILRIFLNMVLNLWVIGSLDFLSLEDGCRIHMKEFYLVVTQLLFGTVDLLSSCLILKRYAFSGYRGAPMTLLASVLTIPIYAPTLRPSIIVVTIFGFFATNVAIIAVCNPSFLVLFQFVVWNVGVDVMVCLLVVKSFEHKRRQLYGRVVLPYLIYLDGLCRWIHQVEGLNEPDSQGLIFSLLMGGGPSQSPHAMDYELTSQIERERTMQTAGVQWSEGVQNEHSYTITEDSDDLNLPLCPGLLPAHQIERSQSASQSSNGSLRLYCLPSVFYLGTAESTVSNSEKEYLGPGGRKLSTASSSPHTDMVNASRVRLSSFRDATSSASSMSESSILSVIRRTRLFDTSSSSHTSHRAESAESTPSPGNPASWESTAELPSSRTLVSEVSEPRTPAKPEHHGFNWESSAAVQVVVKPSTSLIPNTVITGEEERHSHRPMLRKLMEQKRRHHDHHDNVAHPQP
eukprot:Blabericola_migrator_1__12806@NODE_824_length_6371_cov_16_326459_g581_i0_p1_GENE_NODE_824_length_6371_cov_16_326459_g581_i0NODE_824_length_6371_cov_16_326459_g581_i0_p1_ORF_typecomplete_len1394_score203_28DUF4660/PF15559_6/0_087_NODE_824_length_6371_cov_16_326459_g581_i0194200